MIQAVRNHRFSSPCFQLPLPLGRVQYLVIVSIQLQHLPALFHILRVFQSLPLHNTQDLVGRFHPPTFDGLLISNASMFTIVTLHGSLR